MKHHVTEKTFKDKILQAKCLMFRIAGKCVDVKFIDIKRYDQLHIRIERVRRILSDLLYVTRWGEI